MPRSKPQTTTNKKDYDNQTKKGNLDYRKSKRNHVSILDVKTQQISHKKYVKNEPKGGQDQAGQAAQQQGGMPQQQQNQQFGSGNMMSFPPQMNNGMGGGMNNGMVNPMMNGMGNPMMNNGGSFMQGGAFVNPQMQMQQPGGFVNPQMQMQQNAQATNIPTTYRIDHEYNYNLSDGSTTRDNFYIEMVEMVSEGGIVYKTANGRKRVTMSFKFDLSIEAHKKAAQKMLEIFYENARHLGTVKNDVGKQHYKANEPFASNHKPGLYFKYTDDGQIDWTVNPTLYVDLYDYKNRITTFRTPMTPEEAEDPNFEPPEIPWSELIDKIVTAIPTIHYVRTHIGVMVVEKIFLDSAIVTKPPEENVKVTRNRETAAKYGTDRDLVEAIRMQTKTTSSTSSIKVNQHSSHSSAAESGSSGSSRSSPYASSNRSKSSNSDDDEENEVSNIAKFKMGDDDSEDDN